jgi:hypothetical protein
MNFNEEMCALHRKVTLKEQIVGWYSSDARRLLLARVSSEQETSIH